MKKLFSLAIFILLPIAYCLLPNHVSAHSSIAVVKMTPKAFEPSEVTIDTDSTVIFLNQDTIERWPASNDHPTHELYPEFDPKAGIKPGASWSFKPKNAGVWKFHDHLDPHLRGTITVIEESQTTPVNDSVISQIIKFIKNSFTNLSDKIGFIFAKIPTSEEFKKLEAKEQYAALTKIADSKGGDKAWAYLTTTFKGEAGGSGNIHDLAHLSGKLLYENKGIKGISECTPTFSFGCYHGFLDAAFAQSLDDLPQAEKECEKVGPVNSGPYGSCIHGIGHGVASYNKVSDIDNALSDCGLLKNGQTFCHDGVFMEFARSAPESFYNKSALLYPCDQLEKENGTTYSAECGRNQPTILASRFGLSVEQIIKTCASKLSDEFNTACFSSVGFSLSQTQDPKQIIAGCGKITNVKFKAECLRSAAGELVFQNAPGWQEKSPTICEASPQKDDCTRYLQNLIKEYRL